MLIPDINNVNDSTNSLSDAFKYHSYQTWEVTKLGIEHGCISEDGTINTLLTMYKPEEMAFYIRLSKQDIRKLKQGIPESERVVNQIILLKQFVRSLGVNR